MTQIQMRERSVSPLYAARRAAQRRKQRSQRETLLDVLRLAGQYNSWMTLGELAGKTKFPPASISAQLRHLRKPKYGSWKIDKRQRHSDGAAILWEYRLGVAAS